MEMKIYALMRKLNIETLERVQIVLGQIIVAKKEQKMAECQQGIDDFLAGDNDWDISPMIMQIDARRKELRK
jgi:hypothetical protein